MQPVRVLCRVDRLDRTIAVEAVRKWQLDNHSVNRRIGVQAANQSLYLGLGGAAGEVMVEGEHACVNSRPVFAPDVHREAGSEPTRTVARPTDVPRASSDATRWATSALTAPATSVPDSTSALNA